MQLVLLVDDGLMTWKAKKGKTIFQNNLKRLLLRASVEKDIPLKAISGIKKEQIFLKDTFAGQTKK